MTAAELQEENLRQDVQKKKLEIKSLERSARLEVIKVALACVGAFAFLASFYLDRYKVGEQRERDRSEPPHVHVERDANRTKFWLDPVRLARSGGFGAAELQQVERLVIAREQLLLGAWDEYFIVTD
jgi:hypothetical protein